MPKLSLPPIIRGLSRRMMAVVTAAALVVSGGIATFGLTGDTTTPAGPEGSFGASGAAVIGSSEAAPANEPPPPTPSPSPSAAADEAAEAVSFNENAGGAGGNNIVVVNNRQDDSFRMRGAIQVNRINAPNVAPQNIAIAYGITCTGCETYAVAMQINLIRRGTNRAVPANSATAANLACDYCTSAAEAIQYTFSVDDPMQTPPDVRELIRAMEAELRAIAREERTVLEAMARVDAVQVQFDALAASLDDKRDVATTGANSEEIPEGPTPSASPAASPTPAPTATPTPTPVPTPIGVTPSPSPTPSP